MTSSPHSTASSAANTIDALVAVMRGHLGLLIRFLLGGGALISQNPQQHNQKPEHTLHIIALACPDLRCAGHNMILSDKAPSSLPKSKPNSGRLGENGLSHKTHRLVSCHRSQPHAFGVPPPPPPGCACMAPVRQNDRWTGISCRRKARRREIRSGTSDSQLKCSNMSNGNEQRSRICCGAKMCARWRSC